MKFGNLSLRAQLISVFVLAVLLLSAVLVTITVIQLQWVKSIILELTEYHTESYYEDKMVILLDEETQRVSEFFNYHVGAASLIASLFEAVFEEVPIVPGEVHYSNDEDVEASLDYGTFFSKNEEISEEGLEAIETAVAIDKLLYNFYQMVEYKYLYAGFNYDDILYLYPGTPFDSDTYSPYTREWFYKANNTVGEPQISDPYEDTVDGEWLVTFSRTFMDGNVVMGVGGCDLLMVDMQKLLSDSLLGADGYELLVSAEGIVLSGPEFFNAYGPGIRIDDVDLTGIDADLWAEISISETDYEFMTFTDPDGVEYTFIKKGMSYLDTGNPTHFLLLCLKKEKITEKRDEIESEFSDLYNMIFWVVLCIALFFLIFIISMMIWFAHRVVKALDLVYNFIRSINQKSCLPKMASSLDTTELWPLHSSIPGLYEACMKKKDEIQSKEDYFSSFPWGDIRPEDITLFDQWRRVVYPRNINKEAIVDLKEVLEKLEQVS